MNKLRGFFVAVWTLVVPLTGVAQQVCQSDSEIPSTSPTNRFIDHGDGTLTDSGTSLMWARCAEGLSGASCNTGSALTVTWQGALDYAASSGLAGHMDWRLPNITELNSIVEVRCTKPAINTTVFPNTPASYFWSASPSSFNSYRAWFVHFDSGTSEEYAGFINNSLNRVLSYHVRLVREVQ